MCCGAGLAKKISYLESERALWGMQFNVAKCKVMHIRARNPQHEYTIGRVVLATTKEKDLGVIMTDKLSPSTGAGLYNPDREAAES